MSRMNFSLVVGAQNATQSGLRSALSDVGKFVRSAGAKPITVPLRIARDGLGLLRDINLGLAPLIRVAGRAVGEVTDMFERGTRIETTFKSFSKLTGLMSADARQFARQMVDASNGTLRTSRAMEFTNRAIASGIDAAKDLPLIFDFASKKALTTGQDFDLAADRLVTGLSRMSAAFLDDFGVLNDGLDGVKRTFDSIKGTGAFDALAPSAQKAEFIRQAMSDIRKQMSGIGVSGKETAFQFQSLKSQLSDMVDRFSLSLSRSRALREVVADVGKLLGGLSKHFDNRGGFWELLTGRGNSSGLFGGLGAIFMDLGEMIGQGLVSSFRKNFPRLAGWLGADSSAPAGSAASTQPASMAAMATAGTPARREYVFNGGVASALREYLPGPVKGLMKWFMTPARELGWKNQISGERMQGMDEQLTLGPVFGRFSRWLSEFTGEFGGGEPGISKNVVPNLFQKGVLRLTEKGEMDRNQQTSLLNREIARQQVLARREARQRSGEEMARLRREGYTGDREIIERELLKDITRRRTEALVNQRDRLQAELAANDQRRNQQNAAGAVIGQQQATEKLQQITEQLKADINKRLEALGEIGAALLSALGAGGKAIAAAGGRQA